MLPFYISLFTLIFVQCLISFGPGSVRAMRPGTTNVPLYHQAYLNRMREESFNRLVNEFWSDWFEIGSQGQMNDTQFRAFSLAKNRVLKSLYSFRTDSRLCRDKGGSHCRVGLAENFCNHPTFGKWMKENCQLSCNNCPKPKPCVNTKPNCDNLARFCTGNFQQHMADNCPRTCGLCVPSLVVRETQVSRQNQTAANNNSESNCFPTECGIAPAMQSQERSRRSLRNTKNESNLKIVGGSRARKGEWPWHGLLVQEVPGRAMICGVTIISNHWLVTAAHCLLSPERRFRITREAMRDFTIHVGRHQGLFGYQEPSVQTFREPQFERFIIHPNFQLTPSFSYDIALIKLKLLTPILFDRHVQPICLTPTNNLIRGDLMTTYGWGDTKNYGPSAHVLKEINLPFVDKRKCKRKVFGLRGEGSLCAGGRRNRDSCDGDSGGSLVKRHQSANSTTEGRFFFYGITSYGSRYCNTQRPYKPSVYTDVTHYYSWIMEQTNRGCPPSPPSRSRGNIPTPTENSLNNTRLERVARGN